MEKLYYISLIIRSNIKHCEIGKFQTDFLQTSSIMLEDRSGRITISAKYSPKHIIKKKHIIKQYINFFKTLDNWLSLQETIMLRIGDRD